MKADVNVEHPLTQMHLVVRSKCIPFSGSVESLFIKHTSDPVQNIPIQHSNRHKYGEVCSRFSIPTMDDVLQGPLLRIMSSKGTHVPQV